MVKEQFWDSPKLSAANLDQLDIIVGIAEEYQQQGYKLTLRQLYYQLVSRDIIPNKQAEYKKISHILKHGRMAGIVDWNIIEDRIRVPYIPYWCTGIPGALQDTLKQYRLNRQQNQRVYIECVSEKDALSGILRRVTKQYHIRLMINRGYSSLSAMYDARNRFKSYADAGYRTVIIYLGDHDPSGLDMIRDVRERLAELGLASIEVIPIALTMDQINQYNPPPDPAKITDPRAAWYIQEYGNHSWEVDALPPNVLTDLLTNTIQGLIDMDIFNEIMVQETADKDELARLIEDFNEESED